MVKKKLLLPNRLRQLPPTGFSWIDRRFVHDGLLAGLEPPQALLYYFLATVGDAQGLSFWGDSATARLLHCSTATLVGARDRLRAADLIAYGHPLYQVLSLPSAPPLPRHTASPAEATSARALPATRKRGGVLNGPSLFLDALAALQPHPEQEVRR